MQFSSLEAEVLRISVIKSSCKEVVLKLEGDLSEAEVSVLEQEGDYWLEQTSRLMLNLQELRHIDEAGIALMQHWVGKRITLQYSSPFLRELLEKHGIAVDQ